VVNDPGGDWDGRGADTRAAQTVVDEIRAAGGEAVANFDSCSSWVGAQGLVDQAVATFGGLNILVNNAGFVRDKMAFNMPESDWDSVIDVHLKGHFAPSHFAAAYWRQRAKDGLDVYGRIINTTSESAFIGLLGQANYAAAKSGIIGLTLVLARELERLGVTVNAIAPRARTRMTTNTWDAYGTETADGFDDRAPETVSPVVAWLAGPEAADISAQVFVVYGGSVELLGGYHTVASIDAGPRIWPVHELAEKGRELFEGRHSGVAPRTATSGA